MKEFKFGKHKKLSLKIEKSNLLASLTADLTVENLLTLSKNVWGVLCCASCLHRLIGDLSYRCFLIW